MTTAPGALQRLNPLTGLGLVTLLGIGVSFIFRPVPLLALHALVVALLLAGGAGLRRLLVTHLAMTPFAVGVLATNAVSRAGTVLLTWGPLTVTDQGLVVGAALAMRVYVVAVGSVAVAAAIDPTRLMTAAMQHLRLDASAGYALLSAHRMLAALPQQWTMLLAAGRTRAPLDRRGRPKLGPRGYGRAAFGLLVGSIRRGERIADALQVRGLRASHRTPRPSVPFTATDVLVASMTIALCGLVVTAAWTLV